MASPREIRVAYHLVDIRNWKSIQAQGLLSTRRLVELSTNVERSMLRQHRLTGEYLDCGAYIRAQGAISRKSLARALRSGVTPEDWFELLNSKVFFWLDLDRLNHYRAACKSEKQVVLALDAGRMLEEYAPFASVSPISLGNAMRAAAPRNLTTFVPYDRWVESGWDCEQVPGLSRRPRSLWPTELTITGDIPDIARFVIGSAYLDASEQLTERHLTTAARAGRSEKSIQWQASK
ncbi:MAG: DUF7002 family protein [Telluria sp.]